MCKKCRKRDFDELAGNWQGFALSCPGIFFSQVNAQTELMMKRKHKKLKVVVPDLSLTFLVSGASYEALYETYFVSILFDFAFRVR